MSFVPNYQQPDNILYLRLHIQPIPSNWTDANIRLHFQKYGPLNEVTLIKKDDTHNQAIVKFQKMQDAEKALKHLKDQALEENQEPLLIKWAEGEKDRLGIAEEQSPKLQVDGLPKECDEHMIREIFERYGQVTDVQIQNQGQSQATAFVSYTFKESCLQAIKNIHSRSFFGDRPLDVRFIGMPATITRNSINDPLNSEDVGDPIREFTKSYTRWLDQKKKPIYIHWETGEIVRNVSFGSIIYSPDGSKETITKEKYLNDLATFNSKKTGPPGANLFVFHLPNEHKDSDLMELFSAYGNVISARVMTEPRTGKSKGFGFVSFDKPESAQKAKEAMDGHLIDKKKLSVTFKQNDGTIQPVQYHWLPGIMQVQFDPFDL